MRMEAVTRRVLCTAPGLAAALPLMLAGCLGSINPRIETVSRQEALRNQVLGSFEQLATEEYEVASVRAVDATTGRAMPPPAMTPSKEEALAAMQSRMFNRDDVDRFKRVGIAGEGNDGLLKLRESSGEQPDPKTLELAKLIIAEENRDRLVIMKRLVDTTPSLEDDDGMRQVREIFAGRQRELAAAGEWIQLPSGPWRRKAE